MPQGAPTPEELEMLFEDAFVTRDRRAVAQLFEDGAVLGAAPGEARGGERIGRLAAAMWERDFRYLANPQRVVQARDTALVVASQGINVVRRRGDGRWLYAISLLDVYPTEGATP
jgi:SnoaL-like domain